MQNDIETAEIFIGKGGPHEMSYSAKRCLPKVGF